MTSRVRVRQNRDAAGAVQAGSERYALDMGQAGYNASQERIFSQATDTGHLEKSGFEPTRLQDGSVVYGWSAEYARYVDQGSSPHWAPIRPLLGWARRVLGDEGAAYAVQKKIAEEGTEGVEFVREGLRAMRAWRTSRDYGEFITDRL